MSVAEGLLLACGGFLLAVLWMDLIFDSQVRGARGGQLPEQVLASIADYYRRATTTSRPMSRLIAAVMAILLGALVFQSVRGHDPVWLSSSCRPCSPPVPILLAVVRTVPNAVRLGGRADGRDEQSRLARSVYRDHLLCFVGHIGVSRAQADPPVGDVTPAIPADRLRWFGSRSAGHTLCAGRGRSQPLKNRRREPNDALEAFGWRLVGALAAISVAPCRGRLRERRRSRRGNNHDDHDDNDDDNDDDHRSSPRRLPRPPR